MDREKIRTASNSALERRARSILLALDRYAEPAEGDLFGGWDWPTMAAVFPAEVAEFREIRAEAKHRLKEGKWTESV